LPVPDKRSVPASRNGVWWLLGAAVTVVVAALTAAAVLNWPLGGTPGGQSTGQSTTAPPSPDLSVSVPLSTPACDGSYIVVVGSAVNAKLYQRTVQGFLDANPGARYLHAPSTGCHSLRQQIDGVDVYAVYFGPFADEDSACAKKGSVGGDSFVRRLDETSSPERAVSCG
jgi:serine/threonine-protein kinase